VSSPDGTLQYGDGGGNRPFFLQKATRNPNLVTGCGAQFFSDAVIGLDSTTCQAPGGGSPPEGVGTGYFGLPTLTSPVPGAGTVMTGPGNLGRDTFTAPGWPNLDFSILKDTHLTESKMIQFRAEFFNILNFATFQGPGSGLGGNGFGFSTTTATAERQIQFGLRFIF
jgi:hypothetical protein